MDNSLKSIIQGFAGEGIEVLQGVVVTASPLTIRAVNDSSLLIHEGALTVPGRLAISLEENQVVYMLATNHGKKYYVLDAVTVTPSGGGDYNDLSNKPKINGVELVGNKTSADLGIVGNKVLVATTAEWDAQLTLVGELNTVYVYVDHHVNANGGLVPGFKVGDGLAYLIDKPFDDDIFIAHAADSGIHVTSTEKTFWNGKVSAYINPNNLEQLILSTS